MEMTIGGKTYQAKALDLYDLTLGEAREIQRYTGLTIADWRLGLLTFDRHNSDVIAGLIWLLLFRAGDPVRWDVLNATPVKDLLGTIDWSEDQAAMLEELRTLTKQPAESPGGEQDVTETPPTAP
jgi:hypothetical protein